MSTLQPDLTAMNRLVNFRDLGGLPVPPGGRLRHGVLYRSDAPRMQDLPPEGVGWPPALVIDLRSAGEQRDPHPLRANGTEILLVALSVEASVGGMVERLDGQAVTLLGLYRATVAQGAAKFAEIVAAAADAEGPVLVHCAAGKDRTGMVVAVILAAVGVPEEDILTDYELTDANMPAVLERMHSVVTDAVEAAALMKLVETHPELLGTSRPAIAAALELAGAGGRGVAGWLRDAGVSDGQLARVRERLVVDGGHRCGQPSGSA